MCNDRGINGTSLHNLDCPTGRNFVDPITEGVALGYGGSGH